MKAIVCTITVSKHPNADRLQLGYINGIFETVVVGLDTKTGDKGLYFPCESQLGQKFAEINNLIRRKDPDDPTKNIGGLFEENRRVRAQKLRGVKSMGFWCPLSYLEKIGDYSNLVEGDQISELNGVEICKKYISKRNPRGKNSGTKPTKKTYTCFPEHADTAQLKYNLRNIKVGDKIQMSSKLQGSSQRSAYCLVSRDLKWYEKLLQKCGIKIQTEEMQYLNGTRRVVITENFSGYHAPELREKHFNRIKPFLEPHMIVYYEVVGYEPSGAPIMPAHHPSKFKDIKKDYESSVVYSYGLPKGESDIYVYRICYVQPDGKLFDLDWEQVKEKCDLWGINHVPDMGEIEYVDHLPQKPNQFDRIEDLVRYIDELSDGKDLIDPRHPREGVCVRIKKNGWHCFKNKGWTFKVLEGIAKENDNYLDPEEEA